MECWNNHHICLCQKCFKKSGCEKSFLDCLNIKKSNELILHDLCTDRKQKVVLGTRRIQMVCQGVWQTPTGNSVLPRFINVYNLLISTRKIRKQKAVFSGQTESQVTASWNFARTHDSVWPWLACACDSLRSFWPSSNLHEANASFSPFGHSTQTAASWSQYWYS